MKRITFLLFLFVACFAFAGGVSNGVPSSASTQQTPIHLSLCATDGNGNVQYITAEQWQRMSENEKLGYTKEGIVIAEKGKAFKKGNTFIVAMRDAGIGDWYWACLNCDHLPSKSQAKLIYKYIDSLNSALIFFGGEPLETRHGQTSPTYWTNETHDDLCAWWIHMSTGSVNYSKKTNSLRARAVAPVK